MPDINDENEAVIKDCDNKHDLILNKTSDVYQFLIHAEQNGSPTTAPTGLSKEEILKILLGML